MKRVLWRQPPQGVVRCGITAPEDWLCGAKFWLWARVITLARWVHVGKHTHTQFLTDSEGKLLTCGGSEAAPWTNTNLWQVQIKQKAVGGLAYYCIEGLHCKHRKRFPFIALVRIQNLAYVNDWGWVVEKSSWSERGSGPKSCQWDRASQGFWYADTREVKSY